MHRTPLLLIAATLVTASACSAAESEPKPLAEKTEKIEKVEKKTVESITFDIAAEGSSVKFDMQAPFEKQDGAVPDQATTGELNVDLMDLSKSTALIDVNIDQLEIYQQKAAEEGAYGERIKSDIQNEHMKDWLEIGDDAPADVKAKNAVVQFKLESIKDASATNISAMEGDTRKVTFTGVGEFRLHQRSATKEVKLEATFSYDGGTPTGVEVKTLEPVKVDLDEHDVRPRKGFGQLAAKTLEAMSPKVAKEAEVSVAFKAAPKA